MSLCHLLIATCIIGMKKTETFCTFWFEKITNQTPMSMFILALNAQSSIQNCCLILYDCCSSKGKSNKTYCKESIYVHTVHMHYVNMNEWYVETWYPKIPINNSLDFINTLLARVCLEGNVCMYVCSMYYTIMYIFIRTLVGRVTEGCF